MDAAFHFPAWGEPIDLAEILRRAPTEPTVKGMFFQQIEDVAKAASGTSPGRGAYAPLDDYPLHEWIALLVRGAELTYPDAPVREGLRRLGQGCFAMISASMIGKALISVAGKDVAATLRLAPRLYHLTSTVGSAEVSFVEPRRAILQLRDFWDFPDAWHVGIYEGGLRALGKSGEVRVRVLGPAAVDLELVWT